MARLHVFQGFGVRACVTGPVDHYGGASSGTTGKEFRKRTVDLPRSVAMRDNNQCQIRFGRQAGEKILAGFRYFDHDVEEAGSGSRVAERVQVPRVLAAVLAQLAIEREVTKAVTRNCAHRPPNDGFHLAATRFLRGREICFTVDAQV